MSVSKFRDFQRRKSAFFITRSFITNYKQRQFRGFPAAGKLACRKGLTGLQRGPYGIATRAPLQCESGPVATSGGPYGKKKAAFEGRNGDWKMREICVLEKPGGPYGNGKAFSGEENVDGRGRKTGENGPEMSRNESF